MRISKCSCTHVVINVLKPQELYESKWNTVRKTLPAKNNEIIGSSPSHFSNWFNNRQISKWNFFAVTTAKPSCFNLVTIDLPSVNQKHRIRIHKKSAARSYLKKYRITTASVIVSEQFDLIFIDHVCSRETAQAPSDGGTGVWCGWWLLSYNSW